MARGRTWTEEEINYLQEAWGTVSIRTIAKNIKRTETAVTLKAKRLGLGSPYTNEYLSANQVSKLMGIDRHAVIDNWIRKRGLKARKRAMKEFEMWLIDLEDLTEWLENNQDKWDSRKLDIYGLGEEPGWLQEKRKLDMKIPARRFQKWTRQEDMRAMGYFKSGMSYKKIGEKLGRSSDAVERRLSRLDVWGTGEFVGDVKEA